MMNLGRDRYQGCWLGHTRERLNIKVESRAENWLVRNNPLSIVDPLSPQLYLVFASWSRITARSRLTLGGLIAPVGPLRRQPTLSDIPII